MKKLIAMLTICVVMFGFTGIAKAQLDSDTGDVDIYLTVTEEFDLILYKTFIYMNDTAPGGIQFDSVGITCASTDTGTNAYTLSFRADDMVNANSTELDIHDGTTSDCYFGLSWDRTSGPQPGGTVAYEYDEGWGSTSMGIPDTDTVAYTSASPEASNILYFNGMVQIKVPATQEPGDYETTLHLTMQEI
jgi:hypothetical protein